MDNGFHPPVRDARTLRSGRVYKPAFMPPAYPMEQTVQLVKQSPPNAAWICKRGQVYILMRVKQVGINTVVFDYRGKSFVLRFHQTPGIARPLRDYTVADGWLMPLVKRFGLIQEPVNENTEMVKWNTGWCAQRYNPRKTLLASPEYQNGNLFLLCDVKSEPINIRSLGRTCKWLKVLYIEGTMNGIRLELPKALCLLPWMEVWRLRLVPHVTAQTANAVNMKRMVVIFYAHRRTQARNIFNVFGPKVCHRIAHFVDC